MKILLLRLLLLALDVRLSQVRSLGQIRRCLLGPSRNIGMKILLLRLLLLALDVRLSQVVRSGQALPIRSITKHRDENPVTMPTRSWCQVRLSQVVRSGQALPIRFITKHRDENPVTTLTTRSQYQVRLGRQVRLGVAY